MNIYIGVTTDNWYHQLSESATKEDVNFWRPSTRQFRSLKPGEPFLFKLHSPNDYIAGGGFFTEYKVLTFPAAWREFGTRNGCRSELEFRERLDSIRSRHNMARDPAVGCIVLSTPFFFSRSDWIPINDYVPWPANIVSGKRVPRDGDGSALWRAVEKRRNAQIAASAGA